jgi:hypothetical protein
MASTTDDQQPETIAKRVGALEQLYILLRGTVSYIDERVGRLERRLAVAGFIGSVSGAFAYQLLEMLKRKMMGE